MRFSHPSHLLFLLALPAILWYFRLRMPEARRLPVLARLGVVLLLTLAAAGPEFRAGRSGRAVVFVLDRSESVGENAFAAGLRWVNRAIATLGPDDRAGAVVFAGETLVERPVEPRRPISGVLSSPSPRRTDLAGAIRLATGMLSASPLGEIILVSDGNPTIEGASREAAVAAARQIRIDALPLGQARASGEAELVAVEAPDSVRVGEPFELEVTVAGSRGSRVTVKLQGDGREAEQREILPRAGAHRFRFPRRLETPGLHHFEVTVENPGDRWHHDNRGGAVVLAVGRPRVLSLRASGEPGVLERILERSDFSVEVIPPAAAPLSAEALSAYDLVILGAPPAGGAGELSSVLESYVVDQGGGLILLGAGDTFVADEWAASPVAEVLPVEMRPGRRQDVPGVALVLVLDKSGSMTGDEGGLPKLQAAKEAALSLLEVLGPGDSLGIVAFDRQVVPALPLRPGVDPAEVRELFARLEAGGGTELGPALEQACRWLEGTEEASRHVVLLSDGRTGEADLSEVLRHLQDMGVMVSVVGVGSDADRELLRLLAVGTGGRVYFPETLEELPEVFRREGRRIAGRRIIEGRFRPRVGAPHAILRGLERTVFPEMDGHLAMTAREGASVPLVSDRRDPILACWRFGLGRTLVFASDLGSGRTAGWLGWPPFGKLWLQMARWTARPLASERLEARLEAHGERGRIVVDAHGHDGEYLDLLDLRAAVGFPDGSATELPLAQTSPGRYEAEIALTGPGLHLVEVTATGEGIDGEETVLTGLHVGAPAEDRAWGPNRELLEVITRRTGGEILGPDETPRWRRPPGAAWRPVWPPLAAIGLLLFLLDVALRVSAPRTAPPAAASARALGSR